MTLNYWATTTYANKSELHLHVYKLRSADSSLTFAMIFSLFQESVMTQNYILQRPRRYFPSALHSTPKHVIVLILRLPLCKPLTCLSTMLLMLLHAPISFYTVGDTGFPPWCVSTSVSDPADYRSKQVVPLFTAHSHYNLGTLTLSTLRVPASTANNDVDIPSS